MLLIKPESYEPDLGRRLDDQERQEVGKLYPWPRPDRKLCQREDSNCKWRIGKF